MADDLILRRTSRGRSSRQQIETEALERNKERAQRDQERISSEPEIRQPPEPKTVQPPGGDAPDAPAPVSPIVLQVESARIAVDLDVLADNAGEIAAWLWWADVLSRAERELLVLEAHVKRNRATAVASMVRTDPKIAAWRTDAGIDETEQMLTMRIAIADAQRNVVLLREIVLALRPASRSSHS